MSNFAFSLASNNVSMGASFSNGGNSYALACGSGGFASPAPMFNPGQWNCMETQHFTGIGMENLDRYKNSVYDTPFNESTVGLVPWEAASNFNGFAPQGYVQPGQSYMGASPFNGTYAGAIQNGGFESEPEYYNPYGSVPSYAVQPQTDYSQSYAMATPNGCATGVYSQNNSGFTGAWANPGGASAVAGNRNGGVIVGPEGVAVWTGNTFASSGSGFPNYHSEPMFNHHGRHHY